jgi:hypothetical protein
MDYQIASQILIIFMALIGILCVYGIIFPGKLVDTVTNFWQVKIALYLSVTIRLIMGYLLIVAAPSSQHPPIFTFLGYFTIIAAIILIFIGRQKIGQLLVWLKTWPPIGVRAWLVFGIAFCGFIISSLM